MMTLYLYRKKYPVEDFENEELANDFVCPICRLVSIYPLPIVTACNHLFCQSCLSHWLFQDCTTDNCSLGVCPLCRDSIGDFEEFLGSVPIALRTILQEWSRLKYKMFLFRY